LASTPLIDEFGLAYGELEMDHVESTALNLYYAGAAGLSAGNRADGFRGTPHPMFWENNTRATIEQKRVESQR